MSLDETMLAQSEEMDAVDGALDHAAEEAAVRHGLLAGAGVGRAGDIGSEDRAAELDAIAWNLPRPEPERLPPDVAWPTDDAA